VPGVALELCADAESTVLAFRASLAIHAVFEDYRSLRAILPGPYTIAMRRFLLLAAAAVAFAQKPNTLDNYYAPEDDAKVGQRFATQLQAKVSATSEPRLDQIGNRLAAHSPEFHYRFFVFAGGEPSPDTAPAAAFPADWRRLQLDEAIAVAGGMIFVPRPLLSRDDAQLAAILAHAMGHIALRHPTLGMTRGELAQVEVQVASRAMADEAAQRVRAVALKRFAFDRLCETAADAYAVKLLQEAGVGPTALVAYLQTLQAPREGNLSVYPAPSERIQAAQKGSGLEP
jgi:Zn-dependent protease with chaperone function